MKSLPLRYNTKKKNYKNVLWLLGDGRSGTTWAANLLNYENKYRELFEPFHPNFVAEFKDTQPYLYIQPNKQNHVLKGTFSKLFSGDFYHPRVDEDNTRLFYRGLIIKDIFANLYAKWATASFPNVQPILIIRNPIDVASSKLNTKHWIWPTDLEILFLNQKDLVEKHLNPFVEIILKTNEQNVLFLKHIVVWCIINKVLLDEFEQNIPTIKYEILKKDPQLTIKKIHRKLGIKTSKIFDANIAKKPSKVTYRKRHPNTKIENKHRSAALDLIYEFKLDHLYTETDIIER